MQSRKGWRLVAYIAPPLLALGMTMMVSCRDATTSNRAERMPGKSGVTRADTAAAAHNERARLHERNRADWVGVAHNHALDDFRKEMRKPGTLSHSLCKYIAAFASEPDRFPPEKREKGSHDDGKAANAVLATTKLCQQSGAFQPTAFSPREVRAASASARIVQSPATDQLAAAIEAAIYDATDSYDFASRMNPIIDQVASLDPMDQEVILATVSVTQSSFEYWESQYAAAAQEFNREYGSCETDAANLGYSYDEARLRCLNGGFQDALWPSPPPEGRPQRTVTLASFTPLRECNLMLQYRRLVWADFRGALVGGILGFVLGPPGVLAGALKGAAAGSLASFIDSTWDLYWCAMR
jgi:hypothetical protein